MEFRNYSEIKYVEQQKEFMNFFLMHKRLCDEVTGNKTVAYKTAREQKEYLINDENFIYAIRRVQSFMVSFNYAFIEEEEQEEVNKRIIDIEIEFMKDDNYSSLVKRKQSLNLENKTKLKSYYYYYVFKLFMIIKDASKYLQKTLMTSNERNLLWRDLKGFFDYLGDYREEINNVITGFRLADFYFFYNKVVSYYFTYAVFFKKRDDQQVISQINELNKIITSRQFLELIEKTKETNQYSKELHNCNIKFKLVLYDILKSTNNALREKNILPKQKKRVLEDRTGI